MLATEIIRKKRDGQPLSRAEIESFADGLASGGWSDAQAAALAMAICCRGMDSVETVALTEAMTNSGEVLDWAAAGVDGPIVDKHSTGGVGDKVSLLLAPIVAACGGVVPMISGRGLGHTGGTLDKLEALPGYQTAPGSQRLRQVLLDCGCAIVGASERLAPADRRLYAVRDVTATVESLPLITASILSKKLAAGLHGLVLDVKTGNGAFAPTLVQARALAHSLVDVAGAAGLRAGALISDMNQVLGTTAGNALEVAEAIAFLRCGAQEPRLLAVTLALCGRLLQIGGICATAAEGASRAAAALSDGAAAERFARMVAGLGGPRDVLSDAGLAAAPLQTEVLAARAGFVAAIDTRALGVAVVELGGGRRRGGAAVDPRVGFSQVAPLGHAVARGDVLARVHAADPRAAEAALRSAAAALCIGDTAPAAMPVVVETLRLPLREAEPE